MKKFFLLIVSFIFVLTLASCNMKPKEVELAVKDGYIKWQYKGEDNWTSLVKIEDLIGEQGSAGADGVDGKEVEIRVIDNYIKWRYVGEDYWTTLVSINDLKGNDGAQGTNGKEVEFNVESGYIKWRYVGESTWKNLVSLDTLKGADGTNGKEIEIKVESGYIKWRYVGESIWSNLTSLDSLKGEDGADGKDGREIELTVESGYIKWHYVGESTWKNLVSLDSLKGGSSSGSNGVDGEDGADGREVELKVESGYIKWHYVGESTWKNLIAVSTLTGEKGSDGLSAYEIYLKYHPEYTKSEQEWINELVSGKLAESSTVTVTFMVDGKVYSTQKVKYGTKATKPENPTKDGHTFVEWIDENNDKWVFNGYTVDKDLVLYAVFEYDYSLVTFDPAGAVLNTTEAKYTYGQNVTLPTVSKVGYTFEGWYEGDKLYTSGAWQTNENVALVAKWTPNKYKVTLNPGTGSVDSTSFEVTYGEKFSFPICTPSDEVPFAGWFYGEEILTDENGESFDIWNISKAVTLKAEYFIPIYDAEGLANISNNLSGKYKLMNDIDLDGIDWTPIGSYDKRFNGELDGNNYTIKNLYSTKKVKSYTGSLNAYYMGLFAYIENATIENLILDNFYYSSSGSTGSSTSSSYYLGMLAARAITSTISNIKVTNSSANFYTYDAFMGGIVGYLNESSVSNCEVQANLTSSDGYVGGIAGYTNGIDTLIFNSVVDVKITSGGSVGGVVGQSYGCVIDKAIVNVDLSNYTYGGGVLGYHHATTTNIRRVITTGKLNVEGSKSGSIVGYIASFGLLNIERCGSDIDAYLIGTNCNSSTTMTNCYNLANKGFVNYYSNTFKITTSYCCGDKTYNTLASGAGSLKLTDVVVVGTVDKTTLTKDYYVNTLNWNTQVWNFDNVSTEGHVLPLLK